MAERPRGTEEQPLYTVVEHEYRGGTHLYFISCDEGWKESILCVKMYKRDADWLVSLIQGQKRAK